MISIQQAGVEILGNSPRSLYFFCGPEYGVKQKYVDHLSQLYGCAVQVETLRELFRSFERKSLVSSRDTLYVCRYDSDFVKKCDSNEAKKVLSHNVNGCVVCIYDDEKQYKKLDKLFPDNVVRFDNVSDKYVVRYLESDYPGLDDHYVKLVSSRCPGGYGQAKVVCGQLSLLGSKISTIEDEDILRTFGLAKAYTEDQMMLAAASRSFSGVMAVVDTFEDDLSYLINGLCHVSIELDKAMDKRNSNSPYAKYVRKWTREDVYNFFEQAYVQTLKLRSNSSMCAYDSLVYLAALLKFRNIPSVSEVFGV